jgi:BMFP domain-containing protein YqiC
MLGDKRLFDDMARVANGAAGALGGIRSRMEGELRDHVERLLLRMKLVTREEFDVVAALAQKARAEQETLTERLAALEARLAAQDRAPDEKRGPSAKRAPSAKQASSSPPAAKAKPARPRRGAA